MDTQRKPDDQSWEDWVEEKIREAYKEGLFDNLAGQGKPLSMKQNPFLRQDLQLAYSLLRDQGYTLPWIEESQTIDRRLQKARLVLQQRYRWYLAEKERRPAHELLALEQLWRKYRLEFEAEIEAINESIRIYNLKAPSLTFHKHLIILEEEYERIRAAANE